MIKSDLIQMVAKKANLSQKLAKEVVEIFLREIERSLQKGEKVVLSGFGTFYLKKVAAKEVVPFGQEEKRTTVPAHYAVRFRVGKTLKRKIG